MGKRIMAHCSKHIQQCNAEKYELSSEWKLVAKINIMGIDVITILAYECKEY